MDENTVNAGQETVVESQESTTNETVNADSGEIATPDSSSKTVQSPEENATYAKIRREAAAKAKDEAFAEAFGQYGINSYSDWQKAKAEDERLALIEAAKADPDRMEEFYNELKEKDPEIQKFRAQQQEAEINNMVNDLNTQLAKYGIDLQLADDSDEEIDKLENSDEILKYVASGIPLAKAYFLANMDSVLKAKDTSTANETISKITANGDANPGSLSGTAETPESVWDLSKSEFKAMHEKALRGELRK